MKVNGITIAENVVRAGRARMKGQFTSRDVQETLRGIGLEVELVERTADRLLKEAKGLGKIKAITNRLWEAQVKA